MDPLVYEILDLWFGDWTDDEPIPEDGAPQMRLWWGKDDEVDRELRDRFGNAVWSAVEGEYDHWQEEGPSCLALILLLDQIPRNIYRGSPQAFSSDEKARKVAKGAIAAGLDKRMPFAWRYFAYMPLMHSERLADHDLAVKAFGDLVVDAAMMDSYRVDSYRGALEYEHRHRKIIERFGRYPHRNAILGRESTPEEEAFLEEPNSSF